MYKATWNPELGQILDTAQEEGSDHDQYAVSVINPANERIVGHMPQEVSRVSWFFLQHQGAITCKITAKRRISTVPGKGLEVPCRYTFKGKPALIKRLKKLLEQ